MSQRRSDPWPWPADSTAERARRVARSYREALLTRLPDECAALDAQMTQFGQRWVMPTRTEPDLDERVTVRVAAEYVGLTVHGVYAWVYLGKVESSRGRDGLTRVRLGDVLDVAAQGRIRRAERRFRPWT